VVEATASDRPRDPDDVWRIKGSGQLTRPQLAYLRELWRWRDQQAREKNKPAFKILGNEQLLDFARWLDAHPGRALQEGLKLPRNIHGKLQRALEEAAARAATMTAEEWPERKKQPRPEAPSAEVRVRIETLRAACALVGKELGMTPQTIAPRAALEAIAREHARSVPEMMAAGGLLRWQAELMETALKKNAFYAPG
jgi:ribonuclease D